MAIIACRECEKKTSDRAQNCIHCGYPILKKSDDDNAATDGLAPSRDHVEIKWGILQRCNPETGDGSLRDVDTGKYFNFSGQQVEGGKFLRGLVGLKLGYKMLDGDVIMVVAPENASVSINRETQKIVTGEPRSMSKPAFEDLFTFSGRRNRKSYLLYSLAVFGLYACVGLLFIIAVANNSQAGFTGMAVLAVIVVIPSVISTWAVGGQRCRDFGWTGWAVLLTAVPYLGLIFVIAMIVIPGNVGNNRYGPDPLSKG
jgi:uncharacterized membrane protein YhaH (DUF805 family)